MNVFLVEDEALVSLLIEDMLSALGHECVGVCATVEAALRWLDTKPAPDGVLMDVNLRGKPVFPVAEDVRRRGLKMAFSTGYGAAGLPPEWISYPVLQKPFRMVELERVVQAWCV